MGQEVGKEEQKGMNKGCSPEGGHKLWVLHVEAFLSLLQGRTSGEFSGEGFIEYSSALWVCPSRVMVPAD